MRGTDRWSASILGLAMSWPFVDICVRAADLFNDECVGRESLPCSGSMTVDTALATHGIDDPDLSCSNTDEPCTVFYEFIPSETSARIRTDLNSVGSDSVYVVYEVDQLDVCDVALWNEVDCSEDEGIGENGDLCFTSLTPGNVYILMLTGFTSLGSCGEYTLDVECPCLPPNDECVGRQLLPCDGSVTVDTALATHGIGDPDLSCSNTLEPCTVFYEFIPSETSARIRTDLNSVGSDSAYALYEVDQLDVCDVALWNEVDCSEDEGIGENGDLCFTSLTPGNVYILMLTGFTSLGSCGEYTLDVECPCATTPAIPTVSAWSIITMAVLLMTAGAFVLAKRSRRIHTLSTSG